MGIMVISYTLKDVKDDVGYLASLGQARTAQVKRDALIGQFSRHNSHAETLDNIEFSPFLFNTFFPMNAFLMKIVSLKVVRFKTKT